MPIHNRLAWGGRVIALVDVELEPCILEEGLKGLWSWMGRWRVYKVFGLGLVPRITIFCSIHDTLICVH